MVGIFGGAYAGYTMARNGVMQDQHGANNPPALTNDLSSIRLVTCDDSSFQSLLDDKFRGLSSNENFSKINRTAVLVINETSAPLYGIQISWTSADADLSPRVYRRSSFLRPSMDLKSRQLTAQHPILSPGGTALLTPLFSWSDTVLRNEADPANLASVDFIKYKRRSPNGDNFARISQRANSVVASLDAVAFASTVVGPKRESFTAKIVNRRHAEHDQSVATLRSLNGQEQPDIGSIVFNAILGDAMAASPPKTYRSARIAYASKTKRLLRSNLSKGKEVLLMAKAITRSSIC